MLSQLRKFLDLIKPTRLIVTLLALSWSFALYAECPVNITISSDDASAKVDEDIETKIAGLYFSGSSDWVVPCAKKAINSGEYAAAAIAVDYFKIRPLEAGDDFYNLSRRLLEDQDHRNVVFVKSLLEVLAFLSGIDEQSLPDDLLTLLEDKASWFHNKHHYRDVLDWFSYRHQNKGEIALYGNDNLVFLTDKNENRPTLETTMEQAAKIELLASGIYEPEEFQKLNLLKDQLLTEIEASLSSSTTLSETKAPSQLLLIWQLDALISRLHPMALEQNAAFMRSEDWFFVSELMEKHWDFRSELVAEGLNDLVALNDSLLWADRKEDWDKLSNDSEMVLETNESFKYIVVLFNRWHESNLSEPGGIFRSLMASAWLSKQDVSDVQIPRSASNIQPFFMSYVDIYKVFADLNPFGCFEAASDEEFIVRAKKAFVKPCAGTRILLRPLLSPTVTALSKQNPISTETFPNGHSLFFILPGVEAIKIFAELGEEGERAFNNLRPSPVAYVPGKERTFISDIVCRSIVYDESLNEFQNRFYKDLPTPEGEAAAKLEWSILLTQMQVQSSVLLAQYFNNPEISLEDYARDYFLLYHANQSWIKCNDQHLKSYFYYADIMGFIRPENGDDVFEMDMFEYSVAYTKYLLDIKTSHAYFNKI